MVQYRILLYAYAGIDIWDSCNVMHDMHKLHGQKSMIKMNITITIMI